MKATETFSVSMPIDMDDDLRASVEAGEFSSTGEAIRDAVRVGDASASRTPTVSR